MSNGIWLYYTKKGSLAKVQHGEVLRQGSSFKLIFAFEDKDIILNKSLSVAFKKPGGETTPFLPVGTLTEQDLLSNSSRIKFNKIKSSEMTYGLQDGVEYYYLSYDGTTNLTDKYGLLTVITKITDQVGEIDSLDNAETDDKVYFQGSAQLYIEPTFGKAPVSSNVDISQYNAIVNHINEIDSKKVNRIDGASTNLILDGIVDATGEKLRDKEGYENGIYVNDPTHEKQVANKKYVDLTKDEIDQSLNKKLDKENDTATNLTIDNGTANNINLNNGVANNLELKGTIKANSDNTFIEINNPTRANHPVTKETFDDTIGDLNKLESKNKLTKVNLVNAINEATTKEEVADLLLKYIFAEDEILTPIGAESLINVYSADKAINDENGENIAQNIAQLKESVAGEVSVAKVNELIAGHNISSTAHNDLFEQVNQSITSLNSKLEQDIQNAINGLINGADGAYDTLKEIENELKANDGDISNILVTLNNKASVTQLQEVESKIPSVGNGTLTIQKNGTSVGTFTANQSTASTVNITVPTGDAANKGVVTSIDTSTNLPTSNAVKTFVEGKGYATQSDIADFVKVSVVDNVIIIG